MVYLDRQILLGFLFRFWWALRLVGAVGHSCEFAAFTEIKAIRILEHVKLAALYIWSVIRIASALFLPAVARWSKFSCR